LQITSGVVTGRNTGRTTTCLRAAPAGSASNPLGGVFTAQPGRLVHSLRTHIAPGHAASCSPLFRGLQMVNPALAARGACSKWSASPLGPASPRYVTGRAPIAVEAPSDPSTSQRLLSLSLSGLRGVSRTNLGEPVAPRVKVRGRGGGELNAMTPTTRPGPRRAVPAPALPTGRQGPCLGWARLRPGTTCGSRRAESEAMTGLFGITQNCPA